MHFGHIYDLLYKLHIDIGDGNTVNQCLVWLLIVTNHLPHEGTDVWGELDTASGRGPVIEYKITHIFRRSSASMGPIEQAH